MNSRQQRQKGRETLMGLDVWNLVTLTSSGGGGDGDQSFKTNGLWSETLRNVWDSIAAAI